MVSAKSNPNCPGFSFRKNRFWISGTFLQRAFPVFLFIWFLHLLSMNASGQESTGKKENIEALKISFFTKKLNLSPNEAREFWPVYNQYEEELSVLRKNHRKSLMEAKEEFSSLTDQEIEKLVDEHINFRQNEVDLLKKFHPQYKKVLPVKKVALLYKAEEEFKRHLLKQIKARQ